MAILEHFTRLHTIAIYCDTLQSFSQLVVESGSSNLFSLVTTLPVTIIMSRQLGISGFCGVTYRPVSQLVGGQKECPWCFKFISPQGFPGHTRKHKENNERPSKRPRYGRVKLRDVPSAPVTVPVAAAQEVVIDDISSDEDDDEFVDCSGTETEENHADDVDAGNVEEEGQQIVRQGNWRPSEQIKVMKDYDRMNGAGNLKIFVRYVAKEYKRPKFQPKTLRDWLKRRSEIEESGKKKHADRRYLAVVRECVGQYPEMEHRLAKRISNMRSLGIPVESWMVDMEAKILLHEIFPTLFPDNPVFDQSADDDFGFKCSNSWRRNFFVRFGFTQRKIGKKFNKKGTLPEKMNATLEFHTRIRVKQLSKINDPVYGLTSPEYVYSHDQVPIELTDKNDNTVESKGAIEVFDAIGNDSDVKRFCTLNLFGPMKLRADKANLPKPHLVFNASKFQTADEWFDQNERALWDDRVVVSFQSNAWVDTQTHVHGIKEVLGPIDRHLDWEKGEMKGLVFEDNLSSHKTDVALDCWKNELKCFMDPEFVPTKMTDTIQVIDRHIGIQYKRAVYEQ